MIQAFVAKKSDRTIDGMTYKTYLSSRPQSMREANDTRNCTSIRHIVESCNKSLKRFTLLRNTWAHSKIQSQVCYLFSDILNEKADLQIHVSLFSLPMDAFV